ncbi:hypothetical protein ACROYT_G041818 [Oculina patagonica]
MSMKKWQTLAEKKAAVERQNDKILTAMKNKAIEKEFGQLSGEEVFKPLTRRLDRAFTKQIKTDAEEGPNYNMDDFDLYNPFGEDFRPDVETPPPTPPPSPEVPDYSMVESDQDFEEETPTSSPPLTSSPAPPLAEKEDDDDDDDDDDDAEEPPDQEGSGLVDVNDLVDRLYISIGSIKAEKYDNNKFKWKKKSDSEWTTVTLPDGMYDYKDLNDAFQSHTGKTDDSKNIFELYFYTTTYRVTILIANDYELDLSEGAFSELIGFDKTILNDTTNVGVRVPDLTRGVDWIYIHCDLISRAVDNIADDVLYTLSTATLEISYPFSKEPYRLLWHPVSKYRINSIRIRISDGNGNDIFLNDQPVALSIIIEEDE